MRLSIKEIIRAGALGAVAFVAGSSAAPTEAGAHCGAHANSCGTVMNGQTYWCEVGPGKLHRVTDYYYRTCSGTCYNSGTSGCCASASACADAPCKPGGCGSACAYSHSTDFVVGQC